MPMQIAIYSFIIIHSLCVCLLFYDLWVDAFSVIEVWCTYVYCWCAYIVLPGTVWYNILIMVYTSAATTAMSSPWSLQHILLIPTSLHLEWPMAQFMSSSHQTESLSGVDQSPRKMDLYLPFPQILPWTVSHLKPHLGEKCKTNCQILCFGLSHVHL